MPSREISGETTMRPSSLRDRSPVAVSSVAAAPVAAALLTMLTAWAPSLRLAAAQAPGSVIVVISSPTAGSTVAGKITVSASVSAVGVLVRGVQFTLDGANLGGRDNSAPYAVSWDTRKTGNGSHTLKAVARDALGLSY